MGLLVLAVAAAAALHGSMAARGQASAAALPDLPGSTVGNTLIQVSNVMVKRLYAHSSEAEADFPEDRKSALAGIEPIKRLQLDPATDGDTPLGASGTQPAAVGAAELGAASGTPEDGEGEEDKACVTRFDARAVAVGFTTSVPGSRCFFGVDDRDEGSHCIQDDGQYGSLGWCYTAEDGSAWGACSEACPLYGVSKVLADRIDELKQEVLERVEAISEVVGPLARSVAITTAADGTASPGMSSTSTTTSSVSTTAISTPSATTAAPTSSTTTAAAPTSGATTAATASSTAAAATTSGAAPAAPASSPTTAAPASSAGTAASASSTTIAAPLPSATTTTPTSGSATAAAVPSMTTAAPTFSPTAAAPGPRTVTTTAAATTSTSTTRSTSGTVSASAPSTTVAPTPSTTAVAPELSTTNSALTAGTTATVAGASHEDAHPWLEVTTTKMPV